VGRVDVVDDADVVDDVDDGHAGRVTSAAGVRGGRYGAVMPAKREDDDGVRVAPRVSVSTRLSERGVEEVDRIAAAERRSRSMVLRMLIEEAVKARRCK
jgi:hypothetical protein